MRSVTMQVSTFGACNPVRWPLGPLTMLVVRLPPPWGGLYGSRDFGPAMQSQVLPQQEPCNWHDDARGVSYRAWYH
jgi:hypothetical protein